MAVISIRAYIKSVRFSRSYTKETNNGLNCLQKYVFFVIIQDEMLKRHFGRLAGM